MSVTQLPIAQQWTLASIQLVNWGGYDGHMKVDLAGPREVTLITGSTGSGKSTLLDAHIVLMHNPSTALNRASNTNSHRSRSEESRNIVSYMRGVHGQTRDVEGEHAVMLREGTVWSAIAETWHSTDGAVLTALSAFFAVPTDTTRPDVRRDAWIPDEFDLNLLEPFANGVHVARPFPPRVMEKTYPGLQVVPSTAALHRVLWDRLGIGDETAGKNAMALLYKVQAADAVQSVNDLFTKFVLDKPITYAKADEAEGHFTDLRNAWEKIRVIEDQTKRLNPIPGLWADYESGRDELAYFTAVNPSPDQARSPFWKWRWDRESTALEQAEQTAQREHEQAKADQTAAANEAARLEGELQSILSAIAQDDAMSELGGLDVRIESAQGALTRVEQDRDELAQAVGDVLTVPDTRAAFDRQQAASAAFMEGYPTRKKTADDQAEAAKRAQWELANQLKGLREDREHYVGRKDVTDRDRDYVRRRYAELIGLEPHQLPFAGELMDMLPEHEGWRMAAEIVLGGTARSLLVPEAHLGAFRRAGEDELTAFRIPYLVVRNLDVALSKGDPATIGGRLQFREHTYSGWLSQRVSRSARHVCVDSPDDLGDLPAGYKDGVTIQGQTGNRDGGAVGGQKNHKPTIGFTPEAVIARIDAKIKTVEDELVPADKAAEAAQTAVAVLRGQHDAHARFLKVPWDRIAVQETTAALQELLDRRKVLSEDPSVAALAREKEQAKAASAVANKKLGAAETKTEDTEKTWGVLAKRKDEAFNQLMGLDDVPDLHTDWLDDMLTGFRDDPDVPGPVAADFESGPWRKFVRHLASRYEAAAKKRDNARRLLSQTFEDYIREYRDTAGVEDLTTDPDRSYWQFHAILERHRASGVDSAKAEFTEYTAMYGGHELMALALAYENELTNIDARLTEIGNALADQPYGETDTGRVTIRRRDGHVPPVVTQFRKELKDATTGTTAVLTYEQAVAKYERFDNLISQLADPKKRDVLLDVRKHVLLEAQHLEDGKLVKFYRELATTSGGETQELTMFIIAAAIRYKVGSLDAKTPRFAPVFMDEGLIKADPERTQRAVEVWTRLGFQPVIATTTDKHESISRTASVLLTVTKDSSHRSKVDRVAAVTGDESEATG